MKVLLAEDEAVSRELLRAHLAKWGYRGLPAADGDAAWELFLDHDDIEMAIIDWMMPGVDGIELVRRMRDARGDAPLYIIMVTARTETGDIAAGLDAGADDYLTKPLRGDELRARLRVGTRNIALETALRQRIHELNDALAHVRTLQELLPICMHCRRVRDSKDHWQKIEDYVAENADVRFSHGLCGSCLEEFYPEYSHD